MYLEQAFLAIFRSINRVAMRPGEPGKVREFDIWPKNQGISAFYP